MPRPQRGPRPSGAGRRREGGAPPPRGRRDPAGQGPRRASPRQESEGIGGTHVAGRHAVRELLAARRREVKELLLAEHLGSSDVVDEILELARRSGVPVRETNRAALGRLAGLDVHQGVLAIAEPLPTIELDALAKDSGGPATVVALDGVTDPHNVGAVLRSAESAGATGAVLARHGGPAVTATVAKAAAGAVEHLPIASVARIPAALERLKSGGLWVVGLDSTGDSPLFGLELLTEPVVLVLGAEGAGLSRLSRERCDVVASIPRKGRTASLNVSAAAALACYEVLRVRGD